MIAHDVLVIGGGQAGLAAGWHLRRRGIDFAILEAGTSVGGAWPNYYDSLTLFSPAAYSSLPGLAFPGDPAHYPARDEVVAYLRNYARQFDLPVITGASVDSVTSDASDGSFRLATNGGQDYAARAVIAASGGFATPYQPQLPHAELYRGRCLHSSQYREPSSFRGQRVIVVGAGNSALQIALELADVADVTVASRAPIRYRPQRLLGRDVHFWLRLTGLDRASLISDQSTPVLDSGRYRQAIKRGRPNARPMFLAFHERGVVWADGQTEQVDAVIFATGFRPHLPYLEASAALDDSGRPLHRKGVSSSVPGLYYAGLPGQRNLASATLRGVGADAAYLMPRIIMDSASFATPQTGRSPHAGA